MLPVWPARAAALQEGTGRCRPHSSPARGGPPRWALLHRGRVPTRHGDTGGPTAAESREAWPLCSCPAFSEPMKDTGHGGLRGHSRWGHPVSGSGACRLPPPPEWKRRGSQPGWGTGPWPPTPRSPALDHPVYRGCWAAPRAPQTHPFPPWPAYYRSNTCYRLNMLLFRACLIKLDRTA